MKSQSFHLLRWWRGLTLQTRLFLAFTLLFVFCILSLSLLLNNVIQMIRINQQTQAIYKQNRMAYHLKAVVDQYHLALLSYENSDTDRSYSLSEQELQIANEQISRSLSQIFAIISEEEWALFDRFASSSDQLSEVTDQVVEAVDDQDWDAVLELDQQAGRVIEEMNQVVDQFIESRSRQLQAANAEAEAFGLISWITSLVSLPVSLLLAVLVAIVIYQQIHQPLGQLSEASRMVLEDQFRPQMLEKLSARSDEIGAMARQFDQMAAAVSQRTDLLQQEADEIRARIR